jgi:hypothetical protein
MPLSILQNFCCVLQIFPKHPKISKYKSLPVFRGTQLCFWVALQIWSGRWRKTWSTANFAIHRGHEKPELCSTFLLKRLIKTPIDLFEIYRGVIDLQFCYSHVRALLFKFLEKSAVEQGQTKPEWATSRARTRCHAVFAPTSAFGPSPTPRPPRPRASRTHANPRSWEPAPRRVRPAPPASDPGRAARRCCTPPRAGRTPRPAVGLQTREGSLFKAVEPSLTCARPCHLHALADRPPWQPPRRNPASGCLHRRPTPSQPSLAESASRLVIVLVIMTMQFGRINAFNEMCAGFKVK